MRILCMGVSVMCITYVTTISHFVIYQSNLILSTKKMNSHYQLVLELETRIPDGIMDFPS